MTVLIWICVGWCAWAWLTDARERPLRVRATRAADTVDLLALSARRGASLHESLERCVRHLPHEQAEVFLPILHALGRGVSVPDAIALVDLPDNDPLGLALEALRDAALDGRPLSAELDRVGSDLRRLESLDSAAQARRLSVWLTFPLVACHMPAFMLVTVVPALVG